MNNGYKEQSQYTVTLQINNNEQWTKITMKNTWCTVAQWTRDNTNKIQCKQKQYYGNNNNEKQQQYTITMMPLNNISNALQQCIMITRTVDNLQWQWIMITIYYTDNELKYAL